MQMLGRENVSSPTVALLELVKNAYDADASQVTVVFRAASTKKGSITIEDNGHGMGLDDLQHKWMVISTDNKLQDPITACGRIKVGEKGIGRLGLDRLARRTTLITHRAKSNGLKLTIDWTKYERDEGQLQEVRHPLQVVSSRPDGSSGTTLHLDGLRDQWTESDYETLYSDLALLVPPLEDEVTDFRIFFDCDEMPELSGPVVSRMASVAEYTLVSTLSPGGAIHHTLTHRSGDTVEDARHWHEAFDEVRKGYRPACGPLRLKLFFYLRNVSSLRETGVKRADLLEFLQRYQGIRIYRDQFRVMPYGDPLRGGDWLGLNARRVQSPGGLKGFIGEWRLAENQVVGSVFISRHDNPDLRDQTNREGLVVNLAWLDLRKFVLHGIQFLERERQVRYHQKDGLAPKAEVKPALDVASQQQRKLASDLRHAAQELKGTFAEPQCPVLIEMAERTERVAEQLEAAAETYSEEETERQVMLGLATLGIAMAAFGHETARSVNLVLGHAQLIKNSIEHLPDAARSQTEENLRVLVDAGERIEAWGRFALDRISRDKRTMRDIDLTHTVQVTVKAFEGILSRRSITLDLALAERLPSMRAFAMDVEGIIINFLTNSLVALEQVPLNARHIYISTGYDPEMSVFEIVFADSGKGILERDINQIWSPLFTTRVNSKGEPIGTGLGLTIVKNIVEDYRGTAHAIGHGKLGGAEFQVILPRRYERSREDGQHQ